jgi:hypothetical protein
MDTPLVYGISFGKSLMHLAFPRARVVCEKCISLSMKSSELRLCGSLLRWVRLKCLHVGQFDPGQSSMQLNSFCSSLT